MGHAHELALLRPQLLSFAMVRLRNRERAEDAVQETLLAALEGIGRFASESSLKTWVIGILKHKIADCGRSSRREEPMDVSESQLPGSDPEAGFAQGRFFEILESSLGRLPARTGRAFVLREVMGLEVAEICAQLGISPANCWVTLHRARQRLRACPGIRGLAADAV